MSATPSLAPITALSSTTTSIPGYTPSSPSPADTVFVEQQQQQQQHDRIRRAELDLETLLNRERETIDKLDPADPTKFTLAKALQFQFQNLMNDAGVFADPVKRGKYTSPLLKLDNYVQQAERVYTTHIDQSEMSDGDRNVLKTMMRDPDVTKYGPVLTQIGASAASLNNMRVAETQLQKEKEERKRLEEDLKKRDDELATLRKREREFEENIAALGKRPSFYNSTLAPFTPSVPPPSTSPQSAAVPTSVGATRFLGSEIPRAQHTVPETRYDDLVPRRDAYLNSPGAQTTFGGDVQNVLKNVASLALKYQHMATTPMDGAL